MHVYLDRMKRIAAALIAVIVAVLVARAGYFLIVDHPLPSDAILVLAGETKRRPELALRLLSQGYAPRIVLDVPTNATIYNFTEIQLAEQYVRQLPQQSPVTICPIDGLSTKAETRDASRCLAQVQAKTVLIVTSDFHTRRALDIFRHELPQYRFSIAAARDAQQFGPRWWTHRQWAKTFFDESLRFVWWKAVDEWR